MVSTASRASNQQSELGGVAHQQTANHRHDRGQRMLSPLLAQRGAVEHDRRGPGVGVGVDPLRTLRRHESSTRGRIGSWLDCPLRNDA
ncbi:MAG: hypothetical protein ABI251_10600 [Mycobacteriaceae bacterium]